MTDAQRKAFDYEIDIESLKGHGIVERDSTKFSMNTTTTQYFLVDKDRADAVRISTFLRGPSARDPSPFEEGDDAAFSFAAVLNVLGPTMPQRVRFVATYDVASLTSQTAVTPYVYVYRK